MCFISSRYTARFGRRYEFSDQLRHKSKCRRNRLFANRIVIPSVFILFAPAQDSAPTVEFQGTAATAAPASQFSNRRKPSSPAPPLPALATSNPGLNATGGTHSSRRQINALFADWHAENMLWTTFTNTTVSSSDASADLRWVPYTPYP